MLEKMHYIANTATRSQWDDWEFYRTSLAAFIDRQVEKMGSKPKRILILGAGNGNDVPIGYLEGISEEIVLVDIDSKALDNFLLRAIDVKKYSIFNLDLSGLINELKNNKIYTLPTEKKIKCITRLKPKPDLGRIPGKFDLVLNCNYATQLVAPYFLWGVDKSSALSADITKATENLTGRIMKEIFQQIFQLLRPHGGLIHLTDFLELKWNKISGQAIPAVSNQNICGSELPEYTDLFKLNNTAALRWDFFKNQAEEIIFIVLAYFFRK